MKILLTFFVLFFSSTTMAEDITDFEIEGMSIGDSLLDYINKEIIISEIKKGSYDITDKKFQAVYLLNKTFEKYEYVIATVKPNDSKYIIHGIRGMFDIENPNNCLIKQKNISEDLSMFFSKPMIKWNRSSAYDETGQSKVIGIDFDLENGSAGVVCYNYSKHVNRPSGLDVTLRSKEYDSWLLKY